MFQRKELLILSLVILVSSCEGSFFSYSYRTFDKDETFCAGKEVNKIYCKDCKTRVFCEAANLGWPVDCQDQYCHDEKDNARTPPKELGKAVCKPEKVECPAPPPPENIGGEPICTRLGRFPDVESCAVYWECIELSTSAAEKKAVYYQCPEGTYFDPRRESCQALNGKNTCLNMNITVGACKGKPFTKVAHPLNPSFYAFCKPGKMTIEACPSPYQFFSNKTKECVFVCQEDGLFADPKDPKSFITCVKVGTQFKELKQQCKASNSSVFDETIQSCKI